MRRHTLVLAVIAMSIGSPMLAQDTEEPRIMVTGEGRVSAAPDMAIVYLGVDARAADPDAAVAAMNAAIEPVLATLSASGIAGADIQTGQLSLRAIPRDDLPHDDGTPRIDGYIAVTQVSARIRDLNILGDLLGDAVGAGANRLDGITFGLADPEAMSDAALKAAVEDARRKADVLADAAGVSLGPVQGIVEQGGGGGPMPMMMAEASARGAVPVAPGEIETVVTISMTFTLDP